MEKDEVSRMGGLISRDAVSSWLKQYGQDVLHGKYKFSLMYIWKNLMDLPSAQADSEEWNNHTVACLLAELFDDTCACNYNDIDEWLP